MSESNLIPPTLPVADLTRPLTPEEIELVRARTEQINTMTRDQHDFNIVTLEKARDEARLAKLERQKAERTELVHQADDLMQRYYVFDHQISEKSVAICLQRLNYWHRNFPESDITIVFSSDGGSIVNGLALYDRIIQLRAQGHHVTTAALGTAASMAAVLLQAGTLRTMGRETWLLVHQGSYGGQGTSGAMQDTAEWFKRLQDRLANIIVDRANAAAENNPLITDPITMDTLLQKWDRKDWWISAPEALSMGLVDEVV